MSILDRSRLMAIGIPSAGALPNGWTLNSALGDQHGNVLRNEFETTDERMRTSEMVEASFRAAIGKH